MGYSGIMFNNNKGEKVMEEKTITLDRPFFGEKKFTLEEYQKRWRGHPQEIFGFLVDFGTIEEMKFGEKLVELFPKVVEKAFNKIYEEEKNKKEKK